MIAPPLEKQKTLSLKDVSLISDKEKKTYQGQGGGKIKRTQTELKANVNMTEEDMRLKEIQEEDELREQMEASNKIAMALV